MEDQIINRWAEHVEEMTMRKGVRNVLTGWLNKKTPLEMKLLGKKG
jgi:hypothetical protein